MSKSVGKADDGGEPTDPVKKIVPCCASDIRSLPSLVLGACHDLLMIEGKLTGDPMEIAMVSGVRLASMTDSLQLLDGTSTQQSTESLARTFTTASPSARPLQLNGHR